MGNERSIKKVNFEDIQQIWKNNQPILLINTLSDSEQNCLIKRTVSVKDEVRLINEYIRKPSIKIIVYGKNTSEISPYKKIEQLTSLGFYNVFLYPGGLFEWLCLQDIYGYEEFPTTTNELDLLKFKPISAFTFRLKDID
jgi:hypothetical protein|uniref:Rhodanese domain-containing protein n=1 Tax=viral metagenome TaxID=1070528 RepID=A0A6C0IQE8_9ZZZZ